jgi:transcriptional regulator EpsA
MAAKPTPVPAKACELEAQEGARFLRIVSEGMLVKRHFEIFRWLNGELQQFLPHDILIAAWGDFEQWSLKFDITSGLPGVRTAQLAQCPVDDFVRKAHARWLEAGRRPLLLRSDEALEPHPCSCPMHAALRAMRAILVHGMRDQRSGNDSLYIALSAGSLIRGRSRQRLLSLVDALVAQIDGAFRRIAALPLPVQALTVPHGDADGRLELSEREREILESVCQGKTNIDIAVALGISPFTVKNHMQRIFRKIGVTNRTQAAARYFEAMRQAAVILAPEGQEPSQQILSKPPTRLDVETQMPR